MIEARDLTVTYDGRAVLQQVTLTVPDGGHIALMGPSGCGKTTLLRCIGGFEKPTGGEILYKGQNIIGLPPYKRAINTVFQRYALFPHLNVAQNVAFGPDLRKEDKKKTAEEVSRMLALVGLAGFEKRRISSLSGGQQQRVAIARALMTDPELLLLDEITSALDPMLVGEVLNMVAELKAQGTTILMATHEMSFAHEAADRIVLLRHGVIAENGTPAEVMDESQDPETIEFFSHFRH